MLGLALSATGLAYKIAATRRVLTAWPNLSELSPGIRMDELPVRGYRFAEFEFDRSRRRLTRSGVEVLSLSGRAFDVLSHLIENRTRMVSKREIMDVVWPQVVVEENNLTQAISSLRRALGDTRESPRFIMTLAGRGYQFIGDVQPLHDARAGVEAPAAPEPPAIVSGVSAQAKAPGGISRRLLLAGLGGAAAVTAVGAAWWLRSRQHSSLPASIAVLPFKPLYANARNAAVEFGVTELLINRLSLLPGVVIRPLSSVLRFVNPTQDPLAAGRTLKVAAVVDGYVQVQQDRVRLTARLLDVDTGTSLWAGSFTERVDDFFAVQDALTTQLVNALAIDVPAEARRRLLAHSTKDAEAWQLYANGRYQVERRDPQGLRRGREYFEAAERRDPQFALAIAGLSEAWALAGVFGIEPPGPAFGQARRGALRALAIDAQLPQAHVASGHVLTQFDLDLEGGRRQYQQALALAPDNAWAISFLALNTTQSGRLPSALDYIGQAQALEPAAMPFMALGGFIRYFAREYDAAVGQLSRIVESVPNAVLPRQFLSRVLLVRGEAATVIRLLEGRNEPAPGAWSNLGRAYAQAGNLVAARGEIARVEALGADGFGVGFDLALLHLALGERELALTALERAVDDHSQMLGYLNVEPALDPIRDAARFRAIGRRIGLG